MPIMYILSFVFAAPAPLDAARLRSQSIQNQIAVSVASTTLILNINTCKNPAISYRINYIVSSGNVTSPATATYNGVNMVQILSNKNPNGNSATFVQQAYSFTNPACGSTGTVKIAFGSAGNGSTLASNIFQVGDVYEGVNQTRPIVSSSTTSGQSPLSINITPITAWSWFEDFTMAGNNGTLGGSPTPINGQFSSDNATGIAFGYRPFQGMGMSSDGYSYNVTCGNCALSGYAINPDGLSTRLTVRGSRLLIKGDKLLIK